MTRLIVNPEIIKPFLDRLIERHPSHINFINAQIKNYLLKKEKIFIAKEEGFGFGLLFKSLFKKKNSLERKLFKQHGLSGESYYRLNLTDNCFQQYSHYIDILSTIKKDSKNTSMDEIIQIDLQNTQNRRTYIAQNKYYKIDSSLTEHDIKLVRQINNKYSIIELLTIEAYIDEGQRMNHCVGRYVKPSPLFKMYSLRDKKDKAILTMKVDLNNKLLEAASNDNSKPNPQLLDLAIKHLNIDPSLMKHEIEEINHSHYLKKTITITWFILLASFIIKFLC